MIINKKNNKNLKTMKQLMASFEIDDKLYKKNFKVRDFNKIFYEISVQCKMSLQSLTDNPKELLELITECLKPKDIEKKQFGEVFTPMCLVNG